MGDARARSLLLIVNPVSGRGAGGVRAGALQEALTRLGCRVESMETGGRGAATELAGTVGLDFEAVVAVGGDGTLNEVLRGLWASGRSASRLPALGFFPSGTANAAAPAFGLPLDAMGAAPLLAKAPSRLADFGVVTTATGTRPFLLWCGAGYDAVVIDALNTRRAGRMGLLGLLRHAPAVAVAIARYFEAPMAVEVDGQSWSEMSSAIVANVADVAFGATIAATADPFDGVLDVVAAPLGAKLRLPGMTVAMMASSLQSVPSVRSAQGRVVRMTAEGTVPVQVDGEPAGTLPVEVRVAPGGVRLLVP